MAASSLSASLIGVERSASVKMRDLPERLEHATPYAESLYPGFSPFKIRRETWVFLPAGAYDFGGSVGRPVIDDDNLSPVGPGLQIGMDAMKRFREAMFLIICGDNDGKVQRRRIHL